MSTKSILKISLMTFIVLLTAFSKTFGLPVISTQPQSRTVNQGQSVLFSIVASGSGTLNYQWQKDGVDIPNATSDTFSISNAQPWEIGYYRCKVTDSLGSGTTQQATLNISNLPFGAWQGLIAYYPLNGDVRDATKLRNDGINYSATPSQDRFGRDESAYYFKGDSYIQVLNVKNIPQGAQPRTLSLWAKHEKLVYDKYDNVGGWGTNADGQNFGAQVFDWNHWWGNVWNGGVTMDLDSGVAADSEWHNIVLTFDGTTLSFYMDGILCNAETRVLNTQGQSLWIGVGPVMMLNSYENLGFHGKIDEFKVYNRCLSAAEIKDVYLSTTNSSPAVTISGSNSITLEASAYYSDLGATAIDPEDGVLTPTITSNTVIPNIPGTYSLTWSVTDSNNNTRTATRTVNVVDTTAPAIATHADVSVKATSAAGAVVTYADAVAADIVGVASLTYSKASGSIFPIGQSPVTITARDAAGNTATRTFTVTVLWAGEPLIDTAPQPQTNRPPGQSAFFEVSAIGQGLAYQWLRNGEPILGAVGATLSIPSVSATNAGIYACRITNAIGKITTGPVPLTVADSKLLIYQILGKETVEETGANAAAILRGWLLFDRTTQAGAFIWTGKQGSRKVYWIERRPDLAAHSTGPVPGSSTLMAANNPSGLHPEVEHDVIWIKGRDGLVNLSPLDQTVAPITLSGIVGRLSLQNGTQIDACNVSLALDKPRSLLSRANNDTLEQAISRIRAGLILAAYGEGQ